VFARLRQKVKGFRTYLSAGAFAVAGIATVAGQFDLTPVVALIVKNPDSLPLALLAIGILFGVLRFYTDTTAGGYQSANQNAPAFKGVDNGE